MDNEKSLDQFHYHEFLDRCDCMSRNIEDFLRLHLVAEEHKELMAWLDTAADAVGQAYQLCGEIEGKAASKT